VENASVLKADEAAQADAATEAAITGGGGSGGGSSGGGGSAAGPVVRRLLPVKGLEAKIAAGTKPQSFKNEVCFKYGLPDNVQVVEVHRQATGKLAIAMVPRTLNLQPDGTYRTNNGGVGAQVFGIVYGRVVEVGGRQRFEPRPLPVSYVKCAVVRGLLMALLCPEPSTLRTKVVPAKPELELFTAMVEKVLASNDTPKGKKVSDMETLARRYCSECNNTKKVMLAAKAVKSSAKGLVAAAKSGKAPRSAVPAAKPSAGKSAVKTAAKTAAAAGKPAVKTPGKTAAKSRKRAAVDDPVHESDKEDDDADDGEASDGSGEATEGSGDDDGSGDDGGEDGEEDVAAAVVSAPVGRVRRRHTRLPVFEDKDGDEFPEVKGKRVPKGVLMTAEERGNSAVQTLLFKCQLACDSNRHVVGEEMMDYAVYCIGDLQWTGFARVDLERKLRIVIVNALTSRESTTELALKFIRDAVFKATVAKELCEDKDVGAASGKSSKRRQARRARFGGPGGGDLDGRGGRGGRGDNSALFCTSFFGHIGTPGMTLRKRNKTK
jgi:hypothetical protein